MSEPLKRAAHAMLGLGEHTWEEFNPSDGRKELPNPAFFGLSPRQFYIKLSELGVKQAFGADAYGRLAVSMLQKPTSCSLTVISDTGFRHEIDPLIQAFGRRNCAILHLSREGCTFEGDSRSYIEVEGITTIEVHNRFTLERFEDQLLIALGGFIDVSDFRADSKKRSEFASTVDGPEPRGSRKWQS